jgi:hypothetical protein
MNSEILFRLMLYLNDFEKGTNKLNLRKYLNHSPSLITSLVTLK